MGIKIKRVGKESTDKIAKSLEVNTYVMSCYLSQKDLYADMKSDLITVSAELEKMEYAFSDLLQFTERHLSIEQKCHLRNLLK